MEVAVGFEPGPGGFAIPSFVAVGSDRPMRDGRRSAGPCISGVGQSAIGRQIDRSGFQLTLDAILAAVADAGLTVDDIDGLAMFPGGGAANLPGYSSANLYEVQDALGITTTWRLGPGRGPDACRSTARRMAVAAGQARHVGGVPDGEGGQRGPQRGRPSRLRVDQARGRRPDGVVLPLGALSPVCHVAPYATRYLHEYGVTREQLAWIPVTQRAHAGLNPDAVYRDPLTVDDYLGVADDLDADLPVRLRRARRRRHRDRGLGGRHRRRPAGAGGASRRWPASSTAVRRGTSGRTWAGSGTPPREAMWARTDLSPADVDVAQLYDGFTIEAVWWLEALGFCGAGEAGAFVEGGTRISLDGELPLNTWGGQLSGGRLHAGVRPHRRGGAPAAGRGRRPPGGRRRGGGGDQRRRVRGGRRPPHAAVLTAEHRARQTDGGREHMVERDGRSRARSRSSPGRVRRPARASAPARRARSCSPAKGASVAARRPRSPSGPRRRAEMIEDEGGDGRGLRRRRHQGGRVRGDGARRGRRVRHARHPREQHRAGRGGHGRRHRPRRSGTASLDINLRTAFLASKYAVPVMAEQGGGSIVNVSSISAVRGDGTAAYSAAKGAMLALTVDMAYSHGRDGIRVNAIAPGPHHHADGALGVRRPGPRADFMDRCASEAGLLGTAGTGWDVGLGGGVPRQRRGPLDHRRDAAGRLRRAQRDPAADGRPPPRRPRTGS